MTNIPGGAKGRGNSGDGVTQKAALIASGVGGGVAAALLVWLLKNCCW